MMYMHIKTYNKNNYFLCFFGRLFSLFKLIHLPSKGRGAIQAQAGLSMKLKLLLSIMLFCSVSN